MGWLRLLLVLKPHRRARNRKGQVRDREVQVAKEGWGWSVRVLDRQDPEDLEDLEDREGIG